jgi:hypothetical protein
MDIQGINQLTDIQKQFLTIFMREGDIELSLEICNVEVAHFLSWRDNHPTFDTIYRSFLRQYITFVREKMSLIAHNWALKVIKDGGEISTDFKVITKKNAKGETVGTEVHNTTKKSPVPQAALKLAVNSTDINEAILTMANEGLLPANKIKRLLASAESITTEMQDVFSDGEAKDTMSVESAVELFKAALMKVS